MRSIVRIVSLLVIIALAGCTAESTLQGDATPDTGSGTVDANNDRIDWLTVWWKKSMPEPFQQGMTGSGLGRWFATMPPDSSEPGEERTSLWDTVGGKVTLTDPNRPTIRKEANFYARNQRFLDRLSEQAEPYFNFVLGEVQRRNMPVELALLPVIESAYEPSATSPRNAVGLWQLAPGTARQWGLGLTERYDGRRDVSASTNAALDYLQTLNNHFGGDWLLAMAAYNCGELNVTHAIERNLALGKSTDFWSLNLPAETRLFVPRILGLASVIAEPQNYGVRLKTLRDAPVTSIRVGHQIDLAQVANMAEVPLKDIQRLNPGYRHGTTDLGGGNLLLPAQHAQVFEEHMAALDPQERSLPTDTRAVPVSFVRSTTARDDPQARSEDPRTAGTGTPSILHVSSSKVYVVRRGDTLESIAHVARVPMKELMVWNHLKPRTILSVGQRLTIVPGVQARGKAAVVASAHTKGHHSAETLSHNRHHPARSSSNPA